MNGDVRRIGEYRDCYGRIGSFSRRIGSIREQAGRENQVRPFSAGLSGFLEENGGGRMRRNQVKADRAKDAAGRIGSVHKEEVLASVGPGFAGRVLHP